ncbi:MAG: hypothetical protein HXX12_04600 [Geothrix sp.]|uniref:DUF922 domain-containing protein n=1 Tax=Geothrix sp. TaxID=1962974 RepID=UPI0018003776|nr:hypothetical protein [Geothrix sp.]NWJ40235.1 hypothetical protein [Geothrix sp.]WIL21759.1 MAG: hypothetical protein QOZ81_001030 [Geothrix sp.]
MRPLSRFAALCLLIAAPLMAADEHRQIENRRLSWTDFRGVPEADKPFDAYTYWTVHYRYEAPVREGDGFRITVRVWNQLGDRSWVRPHALRGARSAELLNHEQGHYTLGLLCALEFKKAATERRFGPRPQVEIRDLFDQVLRKYVDLEKTYDAETQHMRDRAAQRTWDQRLAQMVGERWVER